MSRDMGEITTEYVSELNRLAVLKVIRQTEQFTKMDLVRQAHLSLPTVTNILDALKGEGYVAELGSDRSRGGRPPMLYHFNSKAGFALGIEIRLPQVAIGLVDLQENLVALEEHRFEDEATSEDIRRILFDGVRHLLATQQVDADRIIGIGLGVPGFVEWETGIWLRYPRMPHLRDIPLQALLAGWFQAPVYIQNESNVYALAELRYGSVPVRGDALLVTLSEGIKATVVADGQILSGRYGNFGAIGHFIVEEGGQPCYCGSRGCLEMYASGYALRQALQTADPAQSPEPWLSADELFRRAAAGDERCRELIEQTLPYVAYAFASLVRLTDIDQMVLLGGYAEGDDYLQQLLFERIAERLPDVTRRTFTLRFGNRHASGAIVRAAAMPAIQAHFQLETVLG